MKKPLILPPELSGQPMTLDRHDQDRLTDDEPAPANVSMRELLLFSILAGLLATLLRSYRYGFDNHLEQLPLIFRLWTARIWPATTSSPPEPHTAPERSTRQ